MNTLTDCIALALSVLIMLGYELWVMRHARLHPLSKSRSAHVLLRQQWVQALSGHKDSEVLAVQVLRNSLMSSTITASTAALMLMGCVTLAASTDMLRALVHGTVDGVHLALMLMIVSTLFATYVCSAMSMRYFNHAGFVMSLPVGSDARQQYEPMCLVYVSRGGVLYGWALRCFLFMAPLVTGLIMPVLMPVTSLLLIGLLHVFDEAGPTSPKA